MSKDIDAGFEIDVVFTGSVAGAVETRFIAIDADLFVPPGAPNYDMRQIDLSLFDYAASLLKQGHDVDFIVRHPEEVRDAQAFLDFHRQKSGHHLVGRMTVKPQQGLDNENFYDAFISNRPEKFGDVMRCDSVPPSDLNLTKRVLDVNAQKYNGLKAA